jgi:RNA polymerase sigma factor (TIGR02999 family)
MVADHYGALRALAERQVTAERARTGQQTISPTSLLGETFRRLVQQETQIANPDHLAAIATMLFVRIIADRRRRRLTIKRGKGAKQLTLGEAVAQSDARTPAEESAHMSDVDVLHDKLAELAQISPRRAEALSLHMIGGITIPNVAKLLKVSVATVERDLALARAWLAAQMG